MAEPNNVTVEEIQGKLLEILLYFKSFCEENDLHFVLAGGTCLGAQRHQGFIPWDDDVDVFMLRDDYEKLGELWAQKADTERYSCVRSNRRYNIHHTATEIKDNHTTFINKHSAALDINQGLMIDVIPLDAIAPTRWGQVWQTIYAMLYCCFNFQRLPEHKSRLTYYGTKVALGVIRSPKLRYTIWKFAEKRLSQYPLEDGCMVASFGEGTAIMRQHFPLEWFRDVSYLPFEGQDMPVAKDYDEYLRISYGDYHVLPPEEEQVCRHDTVFIDLNNGYEKYKGIYYCVDSKS